MPNDAGFAVRKQDPEIVAAALNGLRSRQKTLPAKLFYDEEGCRLFYLITGLPEYYLTRAESSILHEVTDHISAITPSGTTLVEYGASDEAKAINLLARQANDGAAVFGSYVPIDVAAPALERMKARLALRFPQLRVWPVAADFNTGVQLPKEVADYPAFGFFPGSTIGNLEPAGATRFLSHSRAALGPQAHFLLGMDLRKDPSILIPAYDDKAGITAAFNLNLLTRLNREAGANFDLSAFTHRATWNDAKSRIEMHLVSQRAHNVVVGGHTIHFDEDETIHTENSYKHSIDAMTKIAASAGWVQEHCWQDADRRFAVILFKGLPT